ncbi:MAG TPA: hypothetical protein VGQ36_02920 [Thermoanaerobaculia bacterium]|jgi:hypothetical protein|nr:hypothetical protein [Thermoanaerobaculia bacterium]
MPRVNMRIAAAMIAALLFPASALAAAPAIEVVSKGLRATGITPGSDAVWFGMTIDTLAMTRALTRHAAVVRDTDGDGAVLYDMPRISRFSLLFVVDATTGEYAVFRAEGVDAIEHDLHGKRWRAGLEDFDLHADVLEVLVVRPGEGAWTTSAMEGGANDGDGRRDGKFRLKVRDMDPIVATNNKPQSNVRRNDLLVMIDARTLAYAVRPAQE